VHSSPLIVSRVSVRRQSTRNREVIAQCAELPDVVRQCGPDPWPTSGDRLFPQTQQEPVDDGGRVARQMAMSDDPDAVLDALLEAQAGT
jgi:hypothetical protein